MARKNKKDSSRELLAAYQALYGELNRAYWVATTIDSKDILHGLAEATFAIITDLNRADLGQRTEEYAGLKATIARVNTKLDRLRQQIDEVIHAFSVATDLARKIDELLPLAAAFVA